MTLTLWEILAIVLIIFVIVIGILVSIILVKVINYMKTVDKITKVLNIVSDFPLTLLNKILDTFFTK